jgi:hypothetical protein
VPFSLLLFSFLFQVHASRVRTAIVIDDQIVTVKTAIGVATIIQVPDRPTSLVVGDSEAFKIEYLDQAITVKPVRPGAKSNLYIYTDWKRYSVQLVTSQEAIADYIVYLKPPSRKEAPSNVIAWEDTSFSARGSDLNLDVKRVGLLKNEYLFVEFRISGNAMEVDPKWFWLIQNGKSKPINKLALSALSLKQDGQIDGLLQVRLKDLAKNTDLAIEIRRKRRINLKIPKEILWK